MSIYFWAWFLFTPLIILAAPLSESPQHNTVRFLTAVFWCYAWIVLSVFLGPVEAGVGAVVESDPQSHRPTVSFMQVFIVLAGWVPAMLYAGFWQGLRHVVARWFGGR